MSTTSLRDRRASRRFRSLLRGIFSSSWHSGDYEIPLSTPKITTPPLEPPARLPLTTITVEQPAIHYPRATLLGLPAELRLEIYNYIFPHQTTLDRLEAIQDDTCLSSPQRAALLVCRQLFHECYPLLRRTLLVVPQPEYNSVFPLYRDRLALAAQSGALERLMVKDVVIREFADQLPYWAPFLERSKENALPIDVDTIYMTMCMCRIDLWVFRENEGMALQWSRRSILAIKRCVNGVRKVRRVVFYFCGLCRTTRFGQHRGSTGDIVKAIKRNLRRPDGFAVGENEEDNWIAVERDVVLDGKDNERIDLEDVVRYEVAFPDEDIKVDVEFWDSWTSCKRGCVLH